MATIYGFTADDSLRVKRAVLRVERGEFRRASPQPSRGIPPPDVLIGKVKDGPISAVSGDCPGEGAIHVYEFDDDTSCLVDRGFDIDGTDYPRKVYNLGKEPVSDGEWVIVKREPISGHYFIECCLEYGEDSDIKTVGETNSAGVSQKVARADHQHAIIIPVMPPASPSDGQLWVHNCHLNYRCSGTSYETERTSDKSQPNGYPSLSANGLVPTNELGTGTAGGSPPKFLRGDQTWDRARITVKEQDGSPTDNEIHTLCFHQLDRFLVQFLTSGEALIRFVYPSLAAGFSSFESTLSSSYVTLISKPFTTTGRSGATSAIFVFFFGSLYVDADADIVEFRITIDGSAIGLDPIAIEQIPFAFDTQRIVAFGFLNGGYTAGSHTVDIDWRLAGSSIGANMDNAHLVIIEMLGG